MTEAQANEYFGRPANWYWKWQDEGQVFTWSDDSTIAFRSEIAQILERLSSQGLPPFGALLVLLGACRQSWKETPGKAHLLHHCFARLHASPREQSQLEVVCNHLHRLSEFPSDLREDLSARACMAAIVFETATQNRAPTESGSILEQFRWLPTASSKACVSPLRRWSSEMSALVGGLPKLDERTIRLRLETSFDALPKAAEFEPDTLATANELLHQLLRDEELSSFAKVARSVLAFLPSSHPTRSLDEAAVGGYADLSNRGDLDRLLLTEIAMDDMVLATRVAMGEALYLKREPPKQQPMRRRIVMLDSGIRTWGTPRLFIAAIGLAMAAQKNVETEVFRASDTHLIPLDFRSRSELVSHLAALETSIHVGNAIPQLLSRIALFDKTPDVVVATTEDAFADEGFRQKTDELPIGTQMAVVTREGGLRLIALRVNGAQEIKKANLQVNDLLLAEPKRSITPVYSNDPPFPVFLEQKPTPLRFREAFRLERSWPVDGKAVLSISNARQLLLTRTRGAHSKEIATGLKGREALWATVQSEDGVCKALIGERGSSRAQLCYVNIYTEEVRVKTIPKTSLPIRRAFGHNGGIFLDLGDWLCAYNESTSQLTRRANWKDATNVSDRFFLPKSNDLQLNQWRSWSFHPATSTITSVPVYDRVDRLPKSLANLYASIFAIYDVAGLGPVGITRNGELINLAAEDQGESKKIEGVGALVPHTKYRSRDGRYLVLSTEAHPKTLRLIDLVQATSRPILNLSEAEALIHSLNQSPPSPLCPTKIVGVSKRGNLFVREGSRIWTLEGFPDQPISLKWVSFMYQKADLKETAVLRRPDNPLARSYGLRYCRLNSKTSVWVDPRGLLHLVLDGGSKLQLTVNVPRQEASTPAHGWLSTGACFGEPECFGGSGEYRTEDPERVRESLREMLEA